MLLALALVFARAAFLLRRDTESKSAGPNTATAPVVTRSDVRVPPPRPRHVVVVVEENKTYEQIIGSASAPWINDLARANALFTRSFAVAHPSQPNYLALFSGSTHGVDDNHCPLALGGPNLGSVLRAAGYSFVTYAEGLPQAGYLGCEAGAYVRKHNPAANWVGRTLPSTVIRPLRDFPQHSSELPTVAWVIPDLDHDMHDGTIEEGDGWLAQHLGAYARWARGHSSLLVLTWDEDDYRDDNHIPTIIAGAGVGPGRYSRLIDHYAVLRTLEAMYDLPLLGLSARTRPITDIWHAHRAVAGANE